MVYASEKGSGSGASGSQIASVAAARIQAGPRDFAPTGTFHCGSCASEDIQKLSMVYESGTSRIDARTSGTSTGFGVARGGLGVGTAFNSSRTRGTQMSELAKRAAPPKAKLAIGWIFIGLFGSFLVAALLGIGVAILFVALCGFLAFKGFKYNGAVFPPLRATWEQSWLCHRCGTISRIEPR